MNGAKRDDGTLAFDGRRRAAKGADRGNAGTGRVRCCRLSPASEALVCATQEPFDLIITDIIVKMDGRFAPDGGISLIGHLRRMPLNSATKRTVPILAVSGTFKNPGMETILTTAVQVGATAQMPKPLHKGALLSMLDRMLTR
jgi:CheY-like chemotaxis protein